MVPTNRVVIIGAGDHGRGSLEILRSCNERLPAFDVVGFLDDNPSKHGHKVGEVTVLGGLDWLNSNHSPRLGYVLAVAESRAKQELESRLRRFSPQYLNAIHPAACVHSSVRLGVGIIVSAGAVVAFDTEIGDHVTINLNATVGHDCSIGPYSTVAPGANIAGRVNLGEGCSVSLNATVCRGLTIGKWSTVGPGAVALRDLPAGQCMMGNPGRLVPQ